MIWTIKEVHEWDGGWHVVPVWEVQDEDGEQIKVFRKREDAEKYLADREAEPKPGNTSPCCGAPLEYENNSWYRCGQCGQPVRR